MIARAQWPLVIDRRVVGKLITRGNGYSAFDVTRSTTAMEADVFARNALALSKLDAQLEQSPAGRFLLVIPVPQ